MTLGKLAHGTGRSHPPAMTDRELQARMPNLAHGASSIAEPAEHVSNASPDSILHMRVRRARPEDAPAIETLYRMLVVGDENVRVDPERIRALEQHVGSHLFVLETDSGVRGTAFLTICLDAMYGFRPYGVVENIVVETSMRRAGGGRELMDAIEQVARAERCTKLMLLSSAARVDAHQFFSRLGFDGTKKRGFVKYLNRSEERP